MSYSCFISFKQLECNEIYSFLKKIKAAAIENMDEIAADEYHYCPLCRNELYLPDNYMDISREKKESSKNWAINCVFMYRYFYDEEHHLLGMYGVTNKLQDLFDATVHFQNSCDQNYDKDDWEGVKLFEETYDRWMSYSKNDIVQKYNEKNGDNAWEDEHSDNEEYWLDYYRKDMCYNEIWMLFEDTLYYHDNTLYFGFFGPKDFQEINKFVVQCFKKYKEWENEMKNSLN